MEVVIEISKNSNLKYEYDQEKNKIFLDRVLHNSNVFPYNYGFIPNTLAPDNDPIDVILISSHSLLPGSFVKVKIIGIIETSDEKGKDDKVLCVLDNKIDNEYKDVNEVSDLQEHELNKILYFLKHYKDCEDGKFIEVGEVKNKLDALEFIRKYSLTN